MTASPRRPDARGGVKHTCLTGLVDVNFIKFAFEVPQIFLREIQRVGRFPRRDSLELDVYGTPNICRAS